MRCFLNNKNGSTLVLVLIVFAFLFVLGTTMLAVAVANTKTATIQENSMKAYFIARSGAMVLAESIVADPKIVDNSMILAGPTAFINIPGGKFAVDVNEMGEGLVISSEGIVNNVTKKVDVILEKSLGRLLDFMILSKDHISLSNFVTIVGIVATNATEISAINTDKQAFPQAEKITLDAKVIIPDVVIPSNYDIVYDYKITSDEIIKISGDTSIHFEQGVDLAVNKKINVTGNGILSLYVSKGWLSGNHSEFVSDPQVKVFIYSLDNEDFDIRSAKFKGIIYAPYSTVTFTDASGSSNYSGERNFNGSIIANNIIINGNHTLLEHDPDYDPDDLIVELVYGIKEVR